MTKNERVWVDGCFDSMHYGHCNALRQAKLMGQYLVVGVHSDVEIELNKGPTLVPEQHRYAAVRACRWVDEVVENAPYTTQLEFLDKYNCDFCAHGDDITTDSQGVDCYEIVKAANRYKEYKRTEGISTTDIVQRLLENKHTVLAHETSTELISLFSASLVESKGSDVIAYMAGSFDLFHAGHISLLESARALGSYLKVGVFAHEQVFMSYNERCLGLLACKAPAIPTKEFILEHKIDIVVNPYASDEHLFQDAIQMGRYRCLNFENHSLNQFLPKRIEENYQKYFDRNLRKKSKAAHEEKLTNHVSVVQ